MGTAKFNKLIQDIDLNEADIDHDYSNYSEIMDNMGSDSDSSTGSNEGLGIDAMYKSPVSVESDGKKEIPEKGAIISADVGKGSESELYEKSVPITDSLSVDQIQSKIEHEEKKEIPEKKVINAKSNKNGKSNKNKKVKNNKKVKKNKNNK